MDVFARAVVDPDPNVALAAADAALAALVVGVETRASRRRDEDGVVGDGVCVLILGVLILGTRVAGD